MSADGPVLDLDTPDAGAPGERVKLSQVRAPLWVVAVVAVVVAALAVWVTRAVDDERTRREQSAAVRLIVSVPSGADLSGGGNYLESSFNGALTVVNAGPLPIEVTDVSSATAGVRINPVGPDEGVKVPSGEGRQVYVGMGVVCRTWGRRMPIVLLITVTTDDGRRRVQHQPLEPGDWSDMLQGGCPPAF